MTLLSVSLGLLWIAAFWLLTRERTHSLPLTLIGACACMVAVVIAVSSLHAAIIAGYPQDSFWTLSTLGRIGVVTISTLGVSFIFIGLAWKARKILNLKVQISATAWLLFDVAIGWLVFGVIHTISPQVFYTFYRLIFESLPNQWVIDTIFDANRLQSIAAFTTPTLADHVAGVALWAIIPFTIWLHLRNWWRG